MVFSGEGVGVNGDRGVVGVVCSVGWLVSVLVSVSAVARLPMIRHAGRMMASRRLAAMHGRAEASLWCMMAANPFPQTGGSMMKIPKSLHETCAGDHPDSCIAVYHARTGKSESNTRVNATPG